MAWTFNDIPNQLGKTVLVTGANSGLGFETSKALLDKGAKVIMACRSKDKADAAKKKLLSENSERNIDVLELDLADLDKINNISKDIIEKYERLDVLINNAGIMAPPRTLSAQGLEIQFAVNHLGHMALTNNLMPLIEKTKESRVVTVTSGAQYFGRINWDDLQGEKRYNRWNSYSQSKLANVMFAIELDNQLSLKSNNSFSLLAHPGLARTNLQKKSLKTNGSFYEAFAYKLIGPMFQSATMGSLPQLMAAISPAAEGGQQYGPQFGFKGYPKLVNIAPFALIKSHRKKLWDISEELIRINS